MWGRPASPRPVGLGMPPRVHRLSNNGSDPLLESVGSWFRLAVAIARPADLPLAHLGLWFCQGFTLPLYILQESGLLKYFWCWPVL